MGTLALDCGETVVVHRVIHDGMGNLGSVNQCDRHGVVGKAVDEIQRPVDRIHDPFVAATFAGTRDVPGFLAQDRMAGKGCTDRRYDRVLGFDIGRGHDLAVVL